MPIATAIKAKLTKTKVTKAKTTKARAVKPATTKPTIVRDISWLAPRCSVCSAGHPEQSMNPVCDRIHRAKVDANCVISIRAPKPTLLP